MSFAPLNRSLGDSYKPLAVQMRRRGALYDDLSVLRISLIGAFENYGNLNH
jgi:hypothetical protein